MRTMSRHTRRPRARALVPMLVLVLIAALAPAGLLAAEATDEVLVRFRDGTTPVERAAIALEYGLTPADAEPDAQGAAMRRARADTLPTERYVTSGRSMATLRRQLEADPNVVGVAPNGRYELALDPSDPSDEAYYEELWGLDNRGQTIQGTTLQTGTNGIDIDGLQAFGHEQGDPAVVVAVVDDGIDVDHMDLADSIWTNPGESGDGRETNGLDDDGNGFVDDVHGWDFCNGDATVHDPGEDAHGTHVAGTIAASRNGVGVLGVAPGVKLMALKFIDDDSAWCGSDLMAIDAIDYAREMGAHIINASWGGPASNDLLRQAIADSDALFVAAAGNYNDNLDGDGPDPGTLTDPPFFPAEFTLPNILSVAAIDQKGNRAGFSNYGKVSVDIAAPGTNILSTYPSSSSCPSGCYAWSAGTSMAAPHVTGVAALIGSRSDDLLAEPIQLRARILGTGTTLASMNGLTATGRLVNAYRALDSVPPSAVGVNRHGINANTVISATTVSTTMTWPAATDDLTGVASYWLMRSANGGSWGTVTAATTTRSAKRDFVFGTEYRFRLRARDHAGNVGAAVDGPIVKASLVQEATSLAAYTGTWTSTASTTASGGKMRTTSTAGSSVEFTFVGRAIGIVAPKGSTRASVKVYVDGVYTQTVSLYRSSTLARVVIYAKSWDTAGSHRVKLVTAATSGRTRVDIDGAVILK
jgi:subtilisin family serine protease